MTLPRFLERVIDATAPALGGMNRDAVRQRLDGASITLRVAGGDDDPGLRLGFLLAANLAARLYPRIRLAVSAELHAEAALLITRINPHVDVDVAAEAEPTSATLGFGAVTDADVTVDARGWDVYVDTAARDDVPAAIPAWLAAGAIGIGEVFRAVMADELGPRGRRAPQPGAFNLVTLGEPREGLPTSCEFDVGRFRLVGAGAIGQAAAHALAAAGVAGTMVTIDPEPLALSNLQRYVLSEDADVGRPKVDLVVERLRSSALDVDPVPGRWTADLVDEQLPTLVALDSAEARIAVQASLPGPLYNAWTQPADLGWSRHERFGEEPCLACLYWPNRERPSRHEQIAAAFGQHPLRVLGYLVHRVVPVGLPLPAGAIPNVPQFPAPPDADRWLHVPLVDDIAAAAGIEPSDLAGWAERPLADVYQEGICGGALLHLNVGETPQEVIVPLAHQSAFAGIMLATQLIAAGIPELRAARPAAIEARLDVLAGLPQVMARPRGRTAACLCSDSVFRDVYRSKALYQP